MKTIIPKERNFIYDLNQVAKNIYNEYSIYDDGFIVGDVIFKTGKHFSQFSQLDKLKEIIEVPKNKMIHFYSDPIYQAVKLHRKIIKGIDIIDDIIYFVTTEDNIKIGCLKDQIQSDSYIFATQLKGFVTNDYLDDDIKRVLLDNEFFTYKKGKYRLRLIKNLFPLFKADTLLTVDFIPSDGEIFDALLSVNRGTGIINYHVYKCINF